MATSKPQTQDPENVEKLWKLATKYIQGSESNKVEVLFRNMNEKYFDDIMSSTPPHIMRKKLKQLEDLVNPRSPLKGKLDAIFFCVTLWEGQLPTISPYGTKRVKIPLQDVFGDETNLYFADFYCIKKSEGKNHYVILVLTKSSSEADNFCKQNLKILNPLDNPFLWKKEENGQWTFDTVQKRKLWVEVLYTDDVDITGKMLDTNQLAERPASDWCQKDENCPICNVKDEKEEEEDKDDFAKSFANKLKV